MVRAILGQREEGEKISLDSQTWSASIGSASETTLGNVSIPSNETWDLYKIFCMGRGGEFRLDHTGIGATAVFSFTGVGTVGSTITLVDTAGTSKTYICVAENGSGDDNGTVTDGKVEFEAGASTGAHAAAHFKAAVEHANGHNGTITVTVATAQCTLAQDTIGLKGNRIIEHSTDFTDSVTSGVPHSFTGGTATNSDLVGKYLQNGKIQSTDVVAVEPYDIDMRIIGPGTLTIYVTNVDGTTAVCKGMLHYYRRKKVRDELIFDDNGDLV